MAEESNQEGRSSPQGTQLQGASIPSISPDRNHRIDPFLQSPFNPKNWPTHRKWIHIGVLATMTFVTCLAPAIFAPAIADTMAEFGQPASSKLASMVIAIYVLGWASGPLIVAPLSELYGRLWVYHTSNALFVAFSAACAASPSLTALIVFRFLAGCCGSGVLNIGGGTIADLFEKENRGLAMTLWTIGALLGPIAGPIIGGFLSQAHGWRSTLWLTAGAGAVAAVVFAIFMRETYPPVLRRRYLASNAKPENESRLAAKVDPACDQSLGQKLATNLKRPLCLLLFSPAVLLSSCYIAIVYGYQYVLITSLPNVLRDQAGFQTSSIGLGYLGLGIGLLVSLTIFGATSDPIIRRMERKAGFYRPEHRLYPLLGATPLVPAGIFLYGWAAQYGAHWMVILLGTAFLGAGLNATLMSLQTYLIDGFTTQAASVMAASTVLRSLFGAFLPLAAPDMFKSLGLGWGCSLLGFVALIFLPLPLVFLQYGELLRSKRFCDN